MSVEGGVMPSDLAQDATAQEGNPPQADCGQRGSGHLAGPKIKRAVFLSQPESRPPERSAYRIDTI